MKQNILSKIFTVFLFIISIILAWGGIICITYNPNYFKVIGSIVSLLGYFIFFWAVLRYENTSEE